MNILEHLHTTNDPFDILEQWYQDIVQLKLNEPDAVTLITSSKEGKPSGRIVLLKDISRSGLVFHTNYESHKAKDIEENPYVALLIYFDAFKRQIRIEGKARKISDQASDAYFASRAYESQIGAWASQQSQEISNRKQLQDQLQNFQKKYPQNVPRPSHWGGFLVNPNYFEFWVEAPYRLHHRFVFIKQTDQSSKSEGFLQSSQRGDLIWQKKILSP